MRLSKPGTSLGRIGLFVFVFVAPALAFPLVSQQQVPEPHLLSMGKAEQLLREGKPTEALAEIERVIDVDENFADAWYFGGVALGQLKRFAEARDYFVRAGELNPGWGEAHRYASMASADIGKMPRRAPGDGAAGQGNSAAVAGPGEGPGGVQLAQWYRLPTHAELLPYLPEKQPKSWWVLMACKPVDHYHVENCQVLKESSPQFGLGRAMRLAAWQFLIIPERVNGEVMAGSMVSILIDHRAAAAPDPQ